MKKVLFTATVDSHILAFHLPFLKYFKEKGYEVHVATNGQEKIPFCDHKHVVPFERSPLKKNNLKAIKILKEILKKENFDIIHTNTPMGSVITRLAAKKARNKPRVIYMAHGLHFYKGASLKNWLLFYPVEKYLSKYTDTLILINKEDYHLAKKKFKKCKNIEYVKGVGIDEKKFQNHWSLEEKKKLRKALGLSMNDFVLMYPAELNKNKNQMMLIKAMENLIKKYPNIHLLLPGLDSLNGYYQKEVEKRNLKQNIHFLGFRKDIPDLLKITDLAVATSKREGLPVNIMEAITASLPIVATDVRGHRDLIENGKNGFLVPLNNVEEMENKVEILYKEKSIYKKMQQVNQKKQKEYKLEHILTDMKKIYEKRKKVFHLLASNSFSGAENVICTIIDSTKEEYEHFYCSKDGSIKEILKEKNINFCPLKRLSYKEVKKIIKTINPNIIHAHDFKASLLASFLPKKRKRISHIHQNPTWLKKKNLKSKLYQIRSKKIANIIIVSKSILEEYVYKSKIEKKCFKIPNFIEKESIIKKSKEKFNKNYQVAFFGRIIEEKQPLEFLSIIKEYEEKYNPITACFIGDGTLKNVCQEKIKEWNIKSRIEFLGFQKNPFKIIKNCKCVIMPSLFEGFGLTAVESLILKVPVLNSGKGGLKEIFETQSWYICKEKKEYVEKLREILKDKIWHEIDLEKYTNKKYFKEQIEKIYEE